MLLILYHANLFLKKYHTLPDCLIVVDDISVVEPVEVYFGKMYKVTLWLQFRNLTNRDRWVNLKFEGFLNIQYYNLFVHILFSVCFISYNNVYMIITGQLKHIFPFYNYFKEWMLQLCHGCYDFIKIKIVKNLSKNLD